MLSLLSEKRFTVDCYILPLYIQYPYSSFVVFLKKKFTAVKERNKPQS